MKPLAVLLALTVSGAMGIASLASQRGAHEYGTVAVGDTLQILYAMPTADVPCLKPIGSARLVVQQCTAGGGHVYLRIFKVRGGLTLNAISGDTVSLATGPQLATMASACDSALVLMGFRGDTAVNPAALPSPACDSMRARLIRP